MGYSKLIYGGTTKIDLTADTVDAAHLASGYTAHGSDGEAVTGTLAFATYYTSTSSPNSSQGSNGDIWLKTVS